MEFLCQVIQLLSTHISGDGGSACSLWKSLAKALCVITSTVEL